jgi:hypothetical protein
MSAYVIQLMLAPEPEVSARELPGPSEGLPGEDGVGMIITSTRGALSHTAYLMLILDV